MKVKGAREERERTYWKDDRDEEEEEGVEVRNARGQSR